MSRSTTTFVSCLIAITSVACFLSAQGNSNNCETDCYKILAPVCGSDGKSYTNECNLNNANCGRGSGDQITKVKDGYCQDVQDDGCPTSCPIDEQLVCGSDGVTYTTLCGLRKSNCRKPYSQRATFAYMGMCSKSTAASSLP